MRGESVRGVPKRETLIERGMGVGFTGKNAVTPMMDHSLTEGLIAVEVIAQQGDAMSGHLRRMFVQPAFARSAFTVLFVLSVLWHDVLRREGQDLGVTRAHKHRGDGGMIIQRLAIAELTPETVLTMQGFGRKVVGAVKGHQELIAQDAKMRQHPVLLQALKDLNKHWIEAARCDRIKQFADLIVAGNLRDVEQRLGVIVPFGVLQLALILQKRRRLGEKDAKSAQDGIVDGVSGVGTRCAMVRQVSDLSVQNVLEDIEAEGTGHDELLGSRKIATLTMLTSLGNLKPLAGQN
jgi:hypothetical protein